MAKTDPNDTVLFALSEFFFFLFVFFCTNTILVLTYEMGMKERMVATLAQTGTNDGFLALPDDAHLICTYCNIPLHIILIIFRVLKTTLIPILSSLDLLHGLYSAFCRFIN